MPEYFNLSLDNPIERLRKRIILFELYDKNFKDNGK